MKLHDYIRLVESHTTAPLYHGTSADAALEILSDGYLSGKTDHMIAGKTYWGISTSRSPRFHAVDWGDGTMSPLGRSGVSVFGACFVIDQSALRRRFRVIPLDYFAMHDLTSKAFTLDSPRAESEEFVVAKRLPISGFVSKLMVFADVVGDLAKAEALVEAAGRRGIVSEVVGQSLGRDGRRRRWDSKMRSAFADK